MLTDVIKALALRRKGVAEAQTNDGIMLMCLIICLTVLTLLFASQSLARAVELIGEIEF
jgi:hypothetical protein